MSNFITRRPFWINLLAAIILGALIIFGILQLLGAITKHGEFLKVPGVINTKTREAIRLLESKGFDVVITDSVFVDSLPRGVVLKQIPDPNSTVKVNRTILLVVNRVTLPMVDVPALQGKSLTYAMELIKRSHLELGDTSFRPDFMMGSVLEQNYHGAPVASGAKLQWGSRIDLVIGGGLADIRIPVPDLVGMTYLQAKSIMEESGIMTGALITDAGISDTLNSFVYRQNPPRFAEDGENKMLMYIQSGQVMDIWISPVPKVIMQDTSRPKPTPRKPVKPETATDY